MIKNSKIRTALYSNHIVADRQGSAARKIPNHWISATLDPQFLPSLHNRPFSAQNYFRHNCMVYPILDLILNFLSSKTTFQLASILSNLNRNFPTSDFQTPRYFQQKFSTTLVPISNINWTFQLILTYPTRIIAFQLQWFFFQVNWELSIFNGWDFPESLFSISFRTFRL